MNDRNRFLTEFNDAPDTTLFNQIVISHVCDCSTALLERHRWEGKGIKFLKIGRGGALSEIRRIELAKSV
jgi:hypothetical protein